MASPRSRPNVVFTPLSTASGAPEAQPASPPPSRRRPRRRPSYWVFVAVGGIGRLMITVGILLMLFVAYQLWGTGLHESRAQSSLQDEFESLLTSPPTTALATTTTSAGTPPPSAPVTTEAASAELMAAFENGAAVARISIPRIDLDKVVVEGVQVEDLRKGPGHYRSTPFPGQKGNAAIAGHRTTYGAPFNRIDELQPGDQIFVTTPQGKFTYTVLPQTAAGDGSVSGHLVVDPSDVWVLDDAGDNRLTLTACHPKYSARSRIVVQARLDDPPAPTPEPAPGVTTDPQVDPGDPPIIGGVRDIAADLDEGLGGDRTQLRPTLLWGGLLAALFALAALVTRRVGRTRSWALAALPAVAITFVFFEHLDRLLPAR